MTPESKATQNVAVTVPCMLILKGQPSYQSLHLPNMYLLMIFKMKYHLLVCRYRPAILET